MKRIVFFMLFLAGAAQAEGYTCDVTLACPSKISCEADNTDCYANQVCITPDYVWFFSLIPQEDGSWLSIGGPENSTIIAMERLGEDPVALTLVSPAKPDGSNAMMLTVLSNLRMILNVQVDGYGGHTETVFGICEELK